MFAGSGAIDGQFDFGAGVIPADYSGGIAVDDDGLIYVADGGNKRAGRPIGTCEQGVELRVSTRTRRPCRRSWSKGAAPLAQK